MNFDLTNRNFYWFNEISRIPHGSYNEKAISDFVMAFAEAHGLKHYRDDFWNTIVFKDASEGAENASPLILQAHMDMVCDKRPGSAHDFTKDPLDLIDDNGLLKTKDTTLGADDGLGVAWMLSVLEDDDLPHPPLECIFTVQEEVGLGGALHLKPEDIQADRFITLDSCAEATADLCSAGACYVTAVRTMDLEKNSSPVYALNVGGLRGGHSGADIHTEGGNATVLAARILEEMLQQDIDVHFVSLTGGTMGNAIPRTTEIIFASSSDPEVIRSRVKESGAKIAQELESGDPDFFCSIASAPDSDVCADAGSTADLLDYIYLIPNGFQHKSMAIEGLTVTSSNLGIAKTEGNTVTIVCMLRSMYRSATEDLRAKMYKLAGIYGMNVTSSVIQPSWNYSPVSPIRDKFAKACAKCGKELRMQASHGGLEAGVFAGLHPGLDITTVGADCRYFHTYEEELDLASFARGYEILKDILEQCTQD